MEREASSGNGAAADWSAAATPEWTGQPDGSAGPAPEGPLAENPELLVGAAFAGGFLLAKLVRRLGG